MTEYMLIFVFAILLLLPFLPGLLEIYLKKDANPIYIKQDYSKDPAYFGRSFQKILMKALKGELKRVNKVTLSKGKPERLIVINLSKIGGKLFDLTLVDELKVETDKPLEALKEVIIKGDFNIKHSSIFRSLLTLGDLTVDGPLEVKRWIHVEGKANIQAPSNLGVNLYAEEINILAPCTFKRMFAQVIKVGKEPREEDFKDNISSIKGTIKSKGSLNISTQDKKLIIEGDLISDKNIVVNGDVWIKGSILSHWGAILLKGVILGEEGKIKSVVGKKGVILAKGVKVYGYIHTDGEGKVEV